MKEVLQSLHKTKLDLQYQYRGDFGLECINLELDYETFLRKGNEWDPERDINIDHNAKDEVEKRWKWFHSYKSGQFMKYVWVEVTFYFCMIYISATDHDMVFYNSTFEDKIPICFHFLDTVKDADYAIRKHIHPLQIDFCNIRAYEDLRALVRQHEKKSLKRIILRDEENEISYRPKDCEDIWNYAIAAHVNKRLQFRIYNVYFRTMSCGTGIEAIIGKNPLPVKTTTIDDIRCYKGSSRLEIQYWKLPVVCIPCAIHPENRFLKNSKGDWVVLSSFHLAEEYQETPKRPSLKHRWNDIDKDYDVDLNMEQYKSAFEYPKMEYPKNTIKDLEAKGVYGKEEVDIRKKKFLPTLEHYNAFVSSVGSLIS
ncbi:Protein of unknown function [Pyronema omphalodes CBS 100304]|uniref:Uncharacterized protein n=1 Tax=Pyronema omphalodes (strain CBS 100304) TaxID=1076935 RepID=U4KVD9_PYROM|nr:Protein of unknown function [Pyronema omphalodes CBS 100304]